MHSLLRQFLDGEVRYLSLKKVCPNEAQELFDAAKKAAQHRYATYVRMSKIGSAELKVDYSAE
jgi:pyruvate-ferredoxin/flavodoxin oxidoreductase